MCEQIRQLKVDESQNRRIIMRKYLLQDTLGESLSLYNNNILCNPVRIPLFILILGALDAGAVAVLLVTVMRWIFQDCTYFFVTIHNTVKGKRKEEKTEMRIVNCKKIFFFSYSIIH